jgi:hypothetical protein
MLSLEINCYARKSAPATTVNNRRLEDKIRHLCALAALASDEDAWLILSELRILLRQHIDHLRAVAAAKLSGAREVAERRDSSE